MILTRLSGKGNEMMRVGSGCVHLLYSSVDEHLGGFYVVATVYNATVNIGVRASLQTSVYVFFRYIPMSRTAGSYGVLFLEF